MKRLLQLLTKFRQRAPTTRPATEAEAEKCATLVVACCRERGLRVAPGAAARIAGLAREFFASEHAQLLVTEKGGAITGMVWCQLCPPEIWDDRPVLLVDWWYVLPERRRDPRTALALLRGVVAYGLALGARRARISVEAEQSQLVARYQREFGFRRETTHLILGWNAEE